MTNSLLVLLLMTLQTPSPAGSRDWESLRGIAEAEHEILMMIIEKKEWAAVPAKARELFSLSFPADREYMKVEAAREYVDKLIHANQMKLAHSVLDAALAGLALPKHQADILREKGFVCEKEGLEDEARQLFEQSVALERKGP